ncbi:hypothetical protein ACFFSY_29560 [Paenibacillus aurantiacus]|uniref:Uncharacterized protein n=1 Tax=Paenibacillus aurantiacus TaxID=1936118 RepID=A0ABV5KY41_9BACL
MPKTTKNFSKKAREEQALRAIAEKGIAPVSGVQRKEQQGYWYYSAFVKNPLPSLALANEPVGIYISFDKGECPTINHLSVQDPNGNDIPFQWEGAVDTRTEQSYASYSDNSLRHGTIWIMTSLAADELKVFTVKVSEAPTVKAFAENVIQGVESGSVDLLQAGNITVKFDQAGVWLGRSMHNNGIDFNPTSPLIQIMLTDAARVDNAATSSNTTLIFRKFTGNGVVFRESEVVFSFTACPTLLITARLRLWANGKVATYHHAIATDDIPAGVVNGWFSRVQFDHPSGNSEQKSSPLGYMYTTNAGSASKCLLAGVRHIQFLSEAPNSDTGYNSHYGNSNTGGSVFYLIYCWKNNSGTKAISKGTFFSTSGYLASGIQVADVDNEAIRRMNRVFTRAAKDTKDALKLRFVELVKSFLNTSREWALANDNWYFGGLQGLQALAMSSLYGYDETSWVATARAKLDSNLGKYGTGTKAGFIAAWQGNYGWEFIGRDMAILPFLLDVYKKRNDTTNITYITNIIHALADAAVDMEVASGGGGKMYLRNNASQLLPDNYNAEAAALVALAESLSLTENSTRRATFNRIAAQFTTAYEFVNRTPYNQSNAGQAGSTTSTGGLVLSIKMPTNHYHLFNLYEAFRANDIMSLGVALPSPRQYAFEMSSPAGQVWEKETNHQPNRRGPALTHILIACSIARWGNNASDWEQACILLEHVLERMKPSGDLERPMNGWGIRDSDIHNYPIEAQVLFETVYTTSK